MKKYLILANIPRYFGNGYTYYTKRAYATLHFYKISFFTMLIVCVQVISKYLLYFYLINF